MRTERAFETALTVVLVVVVVSLVFGQLLGQPILLGYVATDSMEPTISAGDGFVAVPAFLLGEPQPGDVVVYDARELHGGGLTTHRVVREAEGGYVTKGDANPFTDQDGDEPPVSEGQIVAHALQVNGDVVTIPHLGTAILGVRAAVAAPFEAVDSDQVGTVFVFTGIALFVLAGSVGGRASRERARRRRRRSVVSARAVVLFAVLVVAAAATAAMVVPAGVTEFGIAAAEQPTDDPLVVEPGGTVELDYAVHNGGVLPVLVMVEPASDGVTVDGSRVVLGPNERTVQSVRVTAPDEPGVYNRHVRESRYVLVLPPSVVAALHGVHPLLALLAVDLVVAGFVVAAGIGVFGTGQLRVRSGPDHVPLRIRMSRQLRRLR